MLALGLLVTLAGPGAAQERVPRPEYPGGTRLPPEAAASSLAPPPPRPERSDAGTWDGTWFYVSRDTRAALWIRTVDGRPEVSLQYLGVSSLEGFKTDWSGHADYFHDDGRGIFDLTVLEADANTMRVHWEWTLERRSTRRETAEITIYRTGEGRELVLAFDSSERRIVGPAGDEQALPPRWFWAFRKASYGLALWEELPF